MKRKSRVPFSNLNFENWQNLILVALFIFYLFQFGLFFAKDGFLKTYGIDYLAFWSTGKIADDNGYAEIYDLEKLRNIQSQVLVTQGMLDEGEGSILSPFPAPIFSFFILPFQLLSRADPKQSYWIWSSINLVVLISYLFFFVRKMLSEHLPFHSAIRNPILLILSFPMILNLTEGQVEVFLVVCMGEFIRNALNKKPIPSGIWLGGLLLKPQLLIIIIPTLLIQKNWKVLMGFFVSSGIIIGSSLALSGIKGMKSLIDLWTKFSAGIATSSPERMINLRMVALNINPPYGWIIAIIGMGLTFLAIFYLLRKNIAFGTSPWVMIMLGIFSATIAITWHSHFHMAAVLIPFLLYCSMSLMLNKKVVLYWAVSTPLILMGATLASLILFFFAKIRIPDFGPMALGGSGFFSNLVILGSVLKYFHMKNTTAVTPGP